MTSIVKHLPLAVLALAPSALGQWTVVNLHPAGAARSFAYGVDGDQQVGAAVIGGSEHASLWSGSAATWVDLHPAWAQYSNAYGVEGGQQVGSAGEGGGNVASLWGGTPASWVSLAPAGSEANINVAIAASPDQQVGVADVESLRASLWSGSAASWIDLTPSGFTDSFAYGVRCGQQVGSAGGHACLWNGTAASFVDLHPTAATGGSEAVGVSAGQQAGYARVGDYDHAGLWHGSANSWVDLSPSGSSDSYCLGACAGQQVGYAVIGGNSRASLWTGSAESWVNLHAALPAHFAGSFAQGISRNTSFVFVVGYGFNTSTNRFEALLWKRAITCQADTDQDGFITGTDFDLYVTMFESGDQLADFDGDGFNTGLDFDLYVQAFEGGC